MVSKIFTYFDFGVNLLITIFSQVFITVGLFNLVTFFYQN